MLAPNSCPFESVGWSDVARETVESTVRLRHILAATVIILVCWTSTVTADDPTLPQPLTESAGHCDQSCDECCQTRFRDHFRDDRFWGELFEPAIHTHFSPRGTPLVHLFFLEPAALHRDLFIDYRVGNNVEGGTDEQELEVELEWALTRRLGIIIETPYLGLDQPGQSDTSGFGDLAVAGRALLVDHDTFQFAANLEVETPTGDDQRGLGRGEAAMAPTISTWLDLGNWVTLHSQFGPEFGLESGDTSLLYAAAMTYSFQGPAVFDSAGHSDMHDHHEHDHSLHFEPGLTTLILELTGESGLSGDEQGQTFFELVTGISYVPLELHEVRFGVRFPLYTPQRLDMQYLFTLVRNF